MLKLVAVSLGLLFSIPFVWAQSRVDSDYVQGFSLWQARDYPGASSTLGRYRTSKRYAQTYDVDYWLGTSWCRMTGSERAGVDLLDWGYSFSQMPPSAREQYRAERDACQQFLRQPTTVRVLPPTIVAAALAPATSRAAGKLYYIAGGDKGGLVAYPLRVKRQLPPEEYDARLVLLSADTDAIKGVRARTPGSRVVRYERFILASSSPAHSEATLEMIGRRLDHYVRFLSSEYGLTLPDYFFTVYLVPDTTRLGTLAERIHGLDASPATLGYAFQNDLSVVAVLNGTAVGTLLHELFHLTVRSTYGAIPQWLDEGIASLYETSTVAGDRYYGEPNWRSSVVNQMRNQFPDVQVTTVVTTPWFSDEAPRGGGRNEMVSDKEAYTVALSRYFVMFLQERGALKSTFEAFRDRTAPADYVPAERQAVRMVERTLKKNIVDINKEFFAWYPAASSPTSRLHLGKIEAKEIPRELPAIVEREVTPGSP